MPRLPDFRAVSAEGKLLVLLGIGEKSGIHLDGTDSRGWHGFLWMARILVDGTDSSKAYQVGLRITF